HHGRRAHFGAPGNGPDASHGKVAVSACRADPAVPANAGECPRPREERLGRHCVLPAGFARARCLFERVRTHPGPLLRHGTACAYHGGSGRPSPRSGDRPASGPRPPHGGRRSLTPPSTPSALAARPLAVLSCALFLGVFLGSGVAYFPFSIASLVVLVLGGVLWLSSGGRCSHGFGCLAFGVLLSGLASAALAQMKAEPPAWISAAGAHKVDVIGVVEEPVRFGSDRAVVIMSVQRLALANRTVPVGGRIRLTVRGSVPPLVVGDVIEFTTRLHPPRGLWNPAGYDYGAPLRRAGVHTVGGVTLDPDGNGLRALAHGLSPFMA